MSRTDVPVLRFSKLDRDPVRVIDELTARQGPVAVARLGSGRIVFVTDPALTKWVLVENARNYVRSQTVVSRKPRPIPEPGSLEPWRLERETRHSIHPTFSRKNIDGLWSELHGAALERVADWPAETAFDVYGPVHTAVVRLAVPAMIRGAFDLDLPELTSALRLCASLDTPAHSPLRDSLAFLRPRQLRRFYRAETALRETLASALATRAAGGSAGPNDVVALFSDTAARKGWTGEKLLDNLFALMVSFAGSVSPVTSWVLYELARDPALQERVRAEAPFLAREQPDWSQARWLRAVQSEALRLYPPTIRISRTACAYDDLGGVAVEPGDYVWICTYAFQRSPKLWEAPDEFRPERWLDGSTARSADVFLPFGLGSHKCLGDHLAWRVISAVAVAALARFRLAPAAGSTTPRLNRHMPVRPRDRRIPLRLTAIDDVERREDDPHPSDVQPDPQGRYVELLET